MPLAKTISPQHSPIEWAVSKGFVPFQEAERFMEERVAAIAEGDGNELVWLLEHPPLYTAGTSAKADDLLDPDRFPIHKTGRGGQFTYHGPGQRVAYVMLNLKKRNPDIRAFIRDLEQWLIKSLAAFNITARCHEGRVGVWIPARNGSGEEKIAAIGIRLRKWISFHGISLNINPDLTHFEGIIPCGLPEFGVTSFEKLGHPVSMPEVDIVLREEFEKVFGQTVSTTIQQF